MISQDTYTGDLRYRHSAVYLVALAIITAIAYWPISLHIFSLKNDALNYFLPVRHLVSESFSHNIFPYWTPYLNLGYPLHGDMQSGVWSPVVQFLSLFGPYTLYTLQIETLLYVFLGGAGMFFLLRHFRVHPYANILASTAYMLCGFNSDSAQFLNWIAGTSFLPFVFLFYYRAIFERSTRNGVYAATAMFFLFTSAYPADFILTSYLLLAMMAVAGITFIREKKIVEWRHFIKVHMLMLVVFVLLSGPAILSYIESLPLQERGNGADLDQVMSNPLHPALLSTFVAPLGAWKMPNVEITDPLIRNSYIGIGAFLFAIISFLSKSPRLIVRFCKWASVIFLLFSLGEYGGLRKIAYFTLPLMDAFRHPANAKMFTLFFLCLLAAFTFHSLLKGELKITLARRGWWIATGMVVVVLIASLFTPLSFFNSESLAGIFSKNDGISFSSHLKINLEKVSFADIVILNTIIQLFFLVLIYRFVIKKNKPLLFVLLAVANSILFTMLFQPFTVVKKTSAFFTQKIINENSVPGYPLPELNSTLSENSAGNEFFMAEMGCRNLFNKKIGRSEYRITPCNLLTQNDFWFDTSIRNVVMNYPLLYRADSVVQVKDLKNLTTNDGRKFAFVEQGAVVPATNGDSTSIHLTKFSPLTIAGEIESKTAGMYVLLQNFYPRWSLYIDGQPASIMLANVSFMGFNVSEGKHQFEFRYKAQDLKIAQIVSYIGLLLVLVLSIFGRRIFRTTT